MQALLMLGLDYKIAFTSPVRITSVSEFNCHNNDEILQLHGCQSILERLYRIIWTRITSHNPKKSVRGLADP